MFIVVYYRMRIYARTVYNICGVDNGVAVWMKKAIPEPRLAEQQDCGPAFLIKEVFLSGLQSLKLRFFRIDVFM